MAGGGVSAAAAAATHAPARMATSSSGSDSGAASCATSATVAAHAARVRGCCCILAPGRRLSARACGDLAQDGRAGLLHGLSAPGSPATELLERGACEAGPGGAPQGTLAAAIAGETRGERTKDDYIVLQS